MIARTSTFPTFRLAAALVLALASLTVRAAPFPEKPVRIVVPFTPGAAADISLRLIQGALEKRLGQTVVIDYKSGAGGAIAGQEVARSKPDGYTLLLGATNSFAIDQFMQPREGFDPLRSLVPVVKVAEVPAVLFASKGLNVQSWAALRAKATAPDARINFGSPGVGTTPHLSMLLLAQSINAEFTHIPFRGSQPAIQSLLGNDIQLYMGGFQPLVPFIRDGRVTAIAVVASKRLAALPDVPTTAEAGLPGVLVNNWFALAAPRETPPQVVETLARAVREVLSMPEIRAKYEDSGLLVSGRDGAPLRAEITQEADRWRDLVNRKGLASKE